MGTLCKEPGMALCALTGPGHVGEEKNNKKNTGALKVRSIVALWINYGSF